MKTLKKLTIISILSVINLLIIGQPANKMTLPTYVLYNGGSVGYLYRTIDFDAMITNNQLSNNICTAIRDYYDKIDILNLDVDKRAFQQVAATKWTWDVIDSLLYGRLDNIDSNIAGCWEVLHSPWIYNSNYYKEFVCRSNHAQYGFNLQDTVWGFYGNIIVEGVLLDTFNNKGFIYYGPGDHWYLDVNLIFDKQ